VTFWLAVQRARKPIAFAVVLLGVLGVDAYRHAPQSIFPPLRLARVEVFAYAGDLPPEEVRATVTRPLETALAALPQLHGTRSYSNQGASEIELDFEPHSDPQADLQNVDAALAPLRSALPAVRRIVTTLENANAEPVASYALVSPSLTQAELRRRLERLVMPAFMGAPGIARVVLFGGARAEYRVDLDLAALARAGATARDVARGVAAAVTGGEAAAFERGAQREVLFAGNKPAGARDLAEVAVYAPTLHRFVPLRSLGAVTLGQGLATEQTSFDARHAVTLNVYPMLGADALAIRRQTDARAARILAALPRGITLTRYWDQTTLIAASQRSLLQAIVVGALLALLVIYFFLRSRSLTLVAAAIIPLSMALTVLVIATAGMSLNLMSVGGLAIAVGLIIDETIVVIESIARELAVSPGTARRNAIAQATGRIARALIASTAANVVVFVPLALLSGIPGSFFRALALTLATALVVSILLSLIVAPSLASAFAGSHASARESFRLERAYAALLQTALAHRRAVFLGAVSVLALAIAIFARLPNDFLPMLEEGQFEIKYTLEPGTSLAETDRTAARLERLVLADPAVAHEGRLTGIDTNGLLPTPQNAGTIRVALHDAGAEPYADVAERLRGALSKAAPGADFEFHQLLEDQINDLSGAPEPIQLAVYGPEQRTLARIAGGLAQRIGGVDGVVDPFDGVVTGDRLIRVTPNMRAAHPPAIDELGDALRLRADGLPAGSIIDGDGTLPVRVHVRDGRAPAAALAPLARFSAPERATEIFEENGGRMLRVTAGLEDASLSSVVPKIQRIVAAYPLPPGYRVQFGGAYESQQASFREFGTVLAVALLLVFFVLLATFNSFRLPLVILGTIPLAPVGVALALWLTRTPLNVSSFMGLLLLVGIVVRNGILIVDAAQRGRRAGLGVHEAVVAAGGERLRPILMTTFAALAALLPLALGFGAGSEMERPLAIAVIGGLSTATAFTLIFIPVLYAGLERSRFLRRVNEVRALDGHHAS
jgi:multidrug efflux pump subunit AcrB